VEIFEPELALESTLASTFYVLLGCYRLDTGGVYKSEKVTHPGKRGAVVIIKVLWTGIIL